MRKTLSLLLVFVLLCSFACPAVHAADADAEKLENAIRVVTDSISEAKQIFPDLKTANTISGIFNEFVGVARNTGTFLSIVNGSVTFLKLIGLVQDSKDEAAFLGGAECQNRFSKSTEKIQTRLEFPGTYYYRTNYTQHIAYNCLVSIPLGKSFASGQYSPLREYERMCEEFGKTEQKPARDPEPEINGSFAAPGKTENGFSDAAQNAYYRDAVDWAVENAITEGTDAAHFSPDEGCTRAQTVTFLHRLLCV